MDTSGLWRRVIGSVLQPLPVRLTVVVPSWWSRPRVSRVMDAAGAAGADVVAVPRSRVFAGSAAEDVVVIEIAEELIMVFVLTACLDLMPRPWRFRSKGRRRVFPPPNLVAPVVAPQDKIRITVAINIVIGPAGFNVQRLLFNQIALPALFPPTIPDNCW